MSLCIVHDLPGCLRLRGGSKPEAALLLRGIVLRTHTGVLSIRHSPLAGSLLVLYDPNVLNRGDLLLVLHASLHQGPATHAVAVPSDQGEEAPTLARGLFDIDVLDAAAIGLCIVRRDFRSMTTITLLLGLGEFLESWTKKRSEQSLADSLAKHSIKANLRQGAIEQQVDAATLRAGDMVIVRQGSFIPADGVVMNGEGLVDQSLMSGEAKLQEKRIGSAVFAGSLLEEGELLIQATEDGDRTVWRRTMLLLHDAVQRKASIQGQAEQLASRLAPFSLLLAVLVFAFTGDPRRAASVLMVDYSCAIKLATPLAILAAMRQATSLGAAVRGGRHLEDLAKAVVRQAAAEGLEHDEHHAMVEYVTAHGVASCLEGSRVLLGSRHFVDEDEGVDVSRLDQHVDRWNEQGYTILYLTMGGELLAGFALEDPPRPEAAQVIGTLRSMGVKRVIMLTGDLDGMAERMARELGITEWVAQALPDDKFRYIKELKHNGHTVAMVGDGLTDASALAEASGGLLHAPRCRHGSRCCRYRAHPKRTHGPAPAQIAGHRDTVSGAGKFRLYCRRQLPAAAGRPLRGHLAGPGRLPSQRRHRGRR